MRNVLCAVAILIATLSAGIAAAQAPQYPVSAPQPANMPVKHTPGRSYLTTEDFKAASDAAKTCTGQAVICDQMCGWGAYQNCGVCSDIRLQTCLKTGTFSWYSFDDAKNLERR